MLHFEFGQDRLAEAHALNTLELGQGAISDRRMPVKR